MKVFISADMEGTTGLTNKAQLVAEGAEYQRFQKLMTGDVNAAIAGAFDAGASEVVVNDSHWMMRNILVEELDSRAQLISGFNKPMCMIEGIDETFDAAIFTGYHARAGTDRGVGNHTILGREIIEIRLNGQPVGETAINAAIAGHFGVPVVMVAGDDMVAREAREYLGDVETAVVKTGLDRWVAKCLTPAASGKLIRETAARALSKVENFRPYKVQTPVTFELEFMSTSEATLASWLPGVVREGPRTVSLVGEDPLRAFRACLACILVAWTASDELYG